MCIAYEERKIAKVGKIPPEIKEVWLAAAILSQIKKDVGIIQATHTQQLNCWGTQF